MWSTIRFGPDSECVATSIRPQRALGTTQYSCLGNSHVISIIHLNKYYENIFVQCILKIIVLLIRNKSPKVLNHFPHRTIYLFSAYCSIFPYHILLNKLYFPQVTEQSIYFPFSFADAFCHII